MKRQMTITGCMLTLCFAGVAAASEAETDAWANSDRRPTGTAGASARYEGDVGWTRTDAESGRVSLARGIAVGLDEDGLSFSASHALSARNGLAFAGNLNLSIGLDGQVSVSGGRSVAAGPVQRSAQAGGIANARRFGTTSLADVSARSDRYGRAEAQTFSRNSAPRRILRPLRLRRR